MNCNTMLFSLTSLDNYFCCECLFRNTFSSGPWWSVLTWNSSVLLNRVRRVVSRPVMSSMRLLSFSNNDELLSLSHVLQIWQYQSSVIDITILLDFDIRPYAINFYLYMCSRQHDVSVTDTNVTVQQTEHVCRSVSIDDVISPMCTSCGISGDLDSWKANKHLIFET